MGYILLFDAKDIKQTHKIKGLALPQGFRAEIIKDQFGKNRFLRIGILYNNFMNQIPKLLQGVLWSADIDKLDLEKNASYIVNQILSFGSLDEIRWLFTTYGKPKVGKIFLEKPMKIYTPSALNFSKIILGAAAGQAPDYRYDKNLPRRIG